jgi:hypothetical protein
MLLHGVEAPDIRYRDSLSEGAGDEEGLYSLILANPPFAGSLDYESTAQNLLRVVKTKKTELLFLALFLRLLKPGGRAAVIVPDGVLFGSSKAHINLRRLLVEDQKLDAIVKLPSGVFKPYASASTAILVFTKTDSGGTDDVWFFDVAADGWSLDDKRVPLLADAKLGCEPAERLAPEDHQRNNLPDLLTRWAERGGAERGRGRAEQSFCVGMSEIVAAGYDFSPSRYKELVYREAEHRVPLEIVSDLDAMEGEFRAGLIELKETLVRESGANGDRVPTKSLTALCRCVSGATPSKSDPSNWVGEIPWFSAKDLKTPDLVDSQDHVAQAVVDRGKLRLFPAGTVVLVVRGMILRHSVPIGILRVPATINQDLKALVPHEELDADFLAACLRAQTPRILATVSHAAHGTTRLDSTALSAIRIPVVPLPAQRDLAERVTATRRLLAIEAERTRHLEELIGSLQAGVFS